MKEFIEKLIGRLEEYIETAKAEGDYTYIKPFEIAKEEVNQLAEEYNNDFCEWKWGIDSAQVQCMGDRILFDSRRLFSYCPYCGKKIKVVETAPYKEGE